MIHYFELKEFKFVGGSMQISEKIAELLPNRVLLNEPVIRIDQSTDEVQVVTATGKTFKVSLLYKWNPKITNEHRNFIGTIISRV